MDSVVASINCSRSQPGMTFIDVNKCMDDVAGKLNLSVSQSLTVWVLRRQDTKGGGKC